MQNFAPAGFCTWQDAHTGPGRVGIQSMYVHHHAD
jgi:hypothetical protein